jgi:hypothetical protein
LTVPTFTPKKFVTVLLASLIVALATNGRTPAPRHSSQSSLFGPYPARQAVGQANGSLTSNYYLVADYTPTPVTRVPDRHSVTIEPQAPPPPVRRNYPPLVR